MPIYKPEWTDLEAEDDGATLTIPLADLYFPIVMRAFPSAVKDWTPGSKGIGKAVVTAKPLVLTQIKEFLTFLETYPLVARSKALDERFTDELAESYILDRNATEPAPDKYTHVGELELRAKWKEDLAAVDELAGLMSAAIGQHPTLRSADSLAAVPGNPSKKFHLPNELAKRISNKLGVGLLLLAKDETPSLRKLGVADKAAALEGKFRVPTTVRGQRILLIDDVCQSGSTTWSLAHAMRNAGATEVYAFAAVKTWRDSDNQSR